MRLDSSPGLAYDPGGLSHAGAGSVKLGCRSLPGGGRDCLPARRARSEDS